MRKILLFLTVLAVFGVAGVATAGAPKHTSGVVYAGVTHAEGSTLYVAGDFKDKLLGRGALVYLTRAESSPTPGSILVNARRVVLYTTRGSMIGTAQATQTFNPDGTATLTDGSFNFTKGTGAYEGHKFSGTLDGTYDGYVYTFHYKGVYR